MIDSHAHYTHKRFYGRFRFLTYENDGFHVHEGNFDDIFEMMTEQGIAAYIEPGIEMESNYRALKMAKSHKGMAFVGIGLHPTRTFLTKWSRKEELVSLIENEGVVAIGETGLDYHYRRMQQHRHIQKKWFRFQLNLAKEAGLPLILHIRNADKDALRILKKHGGAIHGGVVHCFVGDRDTALSYVNLGFSLGIGGSLLQKEEISNPLKEAIKAVPLERLLLETDAPYVLPDVFDKSGNPLSRKIRNSSAILNAIANEIAMIKAIDTESVIKVTLENTKKLFKIE